MYGIDVLLEEHDNISEFNQVVREISLRLLGGEEIGLDDLRFCLDFIKTYADGIHHGKEEDILFKEIEDGLGQVGRNLTRHGMLVEHDLARYYVNELGQAIDSYGRTMSQASILDLITYLMAYRDLLERHIYKENELVYSYAENHLARETLDLIDRKTLDFESDGRNKEVKDKYLLGLDRLKARYLK